ncbi:MAG TPA: SpoIIE family protein phosphatase [Urbifossiella sp.]|nr:SpoIIE family protein phosphatase [Urbifossiella sp.]
MTRPPLTVRHVMQAEVVTVAPDTPLDVVIGLMNLYRIGALVVVNPDRSPAGVFTDRDLLRRVAVAPEGWQSLPVADWMTRDPHTIGPEVEWEEGLATLERLRVRHLPVVEGGKVIGIISPRVLVARREEYLNRVVEERTRALRQANEHLLARDAELTYNLRAAARFQTRLLLPHRPPDWPELRWGTHYAPLNHLGGDYYDTALPDPDRLGVLIADASGHSIAAMMVAILSRTAFTQAAATTDRPGEVLAAMNRRLLALADDRFVTAFYGLLDRRTRVFTYAVAGHPPPLRYAARTGEVKPLTGQGFLLGIMPEEVYREREVQLDPGDRLLFYTDGLIEARNEIGETFDTDRLIAAFREHAAAPADRLTAALMAGHRRFCGTQPPGDDVTVVVVELVAQ